MLMKEEANDDGLPPLLGQFVVNIRGHLICHDLNTDCTVTDGVLAHSECKNHSKTYGLLQSGGQHLEIQNFQKSQQSHELKNQKVPSLIENDQ